jgi:hypothetical protein
MDGVVPGEFSTARDEERLQRLLAHLPASLQRAIAWLRRPQHWWVRIPMGLFFLAGSLLFVLPFFGIWMLPLGFALLAEDVPPLRRLRDRLLEWIERRHPKWLRDPLR